MRSRTEGLVHEYEGCGIVWSIHSSVGSVNELQAGSELHDAFNVKAAREFLWKPRTVVETLC